jgi:hypothetical protein
MTYQFTLNESEANVLLQALANMPYAQVFQLIEKLHSQAKQQQEENANG